MNTELLTDKWRPERKPDPRSVWLAEKLGKFGASDMHKLLTGGRRDMTDEELAARPKGSTRKTVDLLFGDTAMTLIYEKIAEILTGQPKEDVSGLKATEWGELHEYEAVEFYSEVTGNDVTYYGCEAPKFFAYNAFSGASPDAKGDRFNVEGKCPFVSSNHVQYLMAARNPQTASAWLRANHFDYFVQCQFAMMSCKTEWSDFFSYDKRMITKSNRLAVIQVPPEAELQADIDYRLKEAGKIISAALSELSTPSIILATSIPEGVLIS